MLPFDLSQYSVTARDDLCMELYRMTERRLAAEKAAAEKCCAESSEEAASKGGVSNDQA